MHVAVFPLPRPARDLHDERRFALDHAVEVMANIVRIVELEQPLAAREQFVHRLRATQQQQPQQHSLLLRNAEERRGTVLVALGARREHLLCQALLLQLPQRMVHRTGIQRHHRLARGLLVGGGLRGIHRQRVGFRRGGFLLDQAAQQAGLGGIQDGRGVFHGGIGNLNGGAAG